MEIKGRTAFITGGASGLGEATARRLVEAGGRVALIDMNEKKGIELASELGEAAVFCSANVTEVEEIDAAVAKTKAAFGGLDIVLNCAGIGGNVKIVGKEGVIPMEVFDRVVKVNLYGTFIVIRATLPALIENVPNEEGERGIYINTASIAAYDGQIGQTAYSSSKGGIVSMTLTLAREFAQNGVRIMTILPGIMDTPLLGRLPQPVRDRLGAQVPFPARLGKPDEFASLACHIVRNPYLNGEFIRLDGGLRMGFGRK